MKIKKIDNLNKFEIARNYQEQNILTFCRQLLKVESLQKNKNLIALIKDIIKSIKYYLKFERVSHFKGIIAKKDNQKETVDYDYYSYKTTADFKAKEAALFAMLGIDNRYFNKDIAKEAEQIIKIISETEHLSPKEKKQIIDNLTLSNEGIYTDGKKNHGIFLVNGEKVFLMDDKEFSKYSDFIRDLKDESLSDLGIAFNSNDGKNVLIKMDSKAFQKYLEAAATLEKEVTPEQPTVTPKQKDHTQKDKKEEPKNSKNSESKSTVKEEKKEFKTFEEYKAAQMFIVNMRANTPEKLEQTTCSISVNNSHVAKILKDGVFIRLPKGYYDKGKWNSLGSDKLHDLCIKIPNEYIDKNSYQNYRFKLPMNLKFELYDNHLNPYMTKDGSNELVPITEIIKVFNIQAITTLSKPNEPKPENQFDLYVDNCGMYKKEVNGMTIAYNKDRAVILDFNKETPLQNRKLEIPKDIEDRNKEKIIIDEIKDGAFIGKNLKEVSIPETIVEIGSNAFANNRNLEKITIADGCSIMGDGVFKNCNQLTDCTLPSTLSEVGVNIFEGCTSMNEYHVREGCCLKEYKGVLFNNSNVYSYPNAKGTEYSVPNKTTGILEKAFYETNIEKVVFPESLIEIRRDAFNGCNALSEVVNHSSSISFGDRVFANTSIKDFNPDKVSENEKYIIENQKDDEMFKSYGSEVDKGRYLQEEDLYNELYNKDRGTEMKKEADNEPSPEKEEKKKEETPVKKKVEKKLKNEREI